MNTLDRFIKRRPRPSRTGPSLETSFLQKVSTFLSPLDTSRFRLVSKKCTLALSSSPSTTTRPPTTASKPSPKPAKPSAKPSSTKSTSQKPKKPNIIITKTTTKIPKADLKKTKPAKTASTTTTKKYFNKFATDHTPLNPGSKPIPPGTGTCLNAKTFVLTGRLDSLEHEEAIDLIKRFGGRVTSAVSGKTTHLLYGEDYGEVKYRKAQDQHCQLWKEDDLLDFIFSGENIDKTSVASAIPSVDSGSVKTLLPVGACNAREELWTEKYRPKSKEQLVGNSDVLKKFVRWMSEWDNGVPDRRGFLLAGPPGIGKTSCVKVVCRELGYFAVEFNASDTRNKKAVQDSLQRILSSGTFGPKGKVCVVMDEVDGMSAGDRGGIAELNAFIRKTTIPIVCICNDVQSKKIASLINHCETVSFKKLAIPQISKRLQDIAHLEGLSIDTETLTAIAERSHGDLRNAVSSLQLYSTASLMGSEKTEEVNYIDAVPQLVMHYSATTWREKLDIYFLDTFMVPLLLHDLIIRDQKHAALIAAFNAMCMGDLVEREIRTAQRFALMPVAGLFSVVFPTFHAKTTSTVSKLVFPRTLGKVSRRKGNVTKATIAAAAFPGRMMSRRTFVTDVLPFLRATVVKKAKTSPEQAALLAAQAGLNKERWELTEQLGAALSHAKFADVSTANKTRFTKALNEKMPDGVVKMRAGGSKRGKASAMEEDEDALAGLFEKPKAAKRDADEMSEEADADAMDIEL